MTNTVATNLPFNEWGSVFPRRGPQGRDQDPPDELPARAFGDLLEHLATLTRNQIRLQCIDGTPVIDQLTMSTATQQRAFELLAQPIPLTIT